jgi:predicted RNase H-like nuclease
MEVFPAAALELFGLHRALRYKKKRGRSWPACQRGLKCLLAVFERLRDPRLKFRKPLAVGNERGKGFKAIEDQADAAFCAYLAGLGWLEGERRMELVRSLEEGYIVLPRPESAGGRP